MPVVNGSRVNVPNHAMQPNFEHPNQYEVLGQQQMHNNGDNQSESENTQHRQMRMPASVRRRPTVCFNDKYVDNMNQQQFQNVKYSDTVKRPRSRAPVTLVATDSMARSIRVNFINRLLGQHSQKQQGSMRKILIDKYPAAHADKIKYYSKWSIREEKPDSLVVIAGANDISYDSYNNNANPNNIAEKIVNIGRDAAQHVQHIYICGLFNRKSDQFKTLIAKTNLQIRLLCEQAGFHFIDTSDIKKNDLDRDGLHLNIEGTKKLTHKILSCCDTYNPTLGPMFTNLQRWGLGDQ
jgi:lysophospholipase L1-like esterase